MSEFKFKHGQKIHVHLDSDGVVDARYNNGELDVRLPNGKLILIQDEYVTASGPEYWPPEPGDIWEAGEREFYIRTSNVPDYLFAASDNGRAGFLLDTLGLDKLQNMNPVLVRRRGVKL